MSKSTMMKGSFRRTGREMFTSLATAFREAVQPIDSDFNTSSGHIEVTNEPFQYTPLSSASSFRLLKLSLVHSANTGPGAGPLRGSLVEASFDDYPEYHALSYTWGDPTPTELVLLDGKYLGITANCAAALRRLMRGKGGMLIWVDSICINQAETPAALEERSKQVAMMDLIYRNAVQVDVHLGEGDAASDTACEAIKKLSTYYTGAILPGPQQNFCRKRYESLADDVLATTPEYPYGKLHGLFRLPWFRRIWVVQEVVFGENVRVFCGRQAMHFKQVVMGADFGRLPYSKLYANPSIQHWKTYLAFHDAMNALVRRRDAGELLSGDEVTISSILSATVMFDATKPDDKVYGLYNVCKRLGFELPAPDYRKPLATVYTEAAQAMLRYGPGLAPLRLACESTSWELGLPSWVPDFSDSFRSWTPSRPPRTALFGKGNPGISGQTAAQYDLTENGRVLRVKGRRLDMVHLAGLPWIVDNASNMLGGAQIPCSQSASSLIESIGSWLNVVQQRSGCQDTTMAAKALLRVLMYDASPSQQSSTLDPESLVRTILALAALSRQDENPHQSGLADPAEASSTSYVGQGISGVQMQDLIGRVFACYWKTVFCTLDGHVGLGTHTVGAGDVVVVFYGSSLAAVLRPCEEYFRYIGPAYMDGLDDGGFWSLSSSARDEWFTLK